MDALNEYRLTAKQERAVLALINQPTIVAAAQALGVGERTLHRWLSDPAFREACLLARRRTFEQSLRQTQRYAGAAVATLAKLMVDEQQHGAVRVAAAKAILDLGVKHVQTEDLGELVDRVRESSNSMDQRKPRATDGLMFCPPSATYPDEDADDDGRRRHRGRSGRVKPIGKLLQELQGELAVTRLCQHCGGAGAPNIVAKRGGEVTQTMESGCPRCGRVSRRIILELPEDDAPKTVEQPQHA